MRITGIGCCLLDSIYNGIDFEQPRFKALYSKKRGDGGLDAGKLVFFDNLQTYSGLTRKELAETLTEGNQPDATNLGGPAVVGMVNAAQLLENTSAAVSFEGVVGDDWFGRRILEIVDKTPLINNLRTIKGESTARTLVLADKNERTFVNDIAVAYKMTPDALSDDFFNSDIVLCGGTALVPNIHDNLTEILRKAKANGSITVVGTVFDFRNEQKDPTGPWPLVTDWPLIDVLVLDAEEAIRISGTDNVDAAAAFFEKTGIGAFIITQGSKRIIIHAKEGLFTAKALASMPVSAYIDQILAEHPEKKCDSTGCGDNFVGGVLASVAKQLMAGKNKLDITECCAWGASSGGFTLLYPGGTFIEEYKGQKAEIIEKIVSEYRKNI